MFSTVVVAGDPVRERRLRTEADGFIDAVVDAERAYFPRRIRDVRRSDYYPRLRFHRSPTHEARRQEVERGGCMVPALWIATAGVIPYAIVGCIVLPWYFLPSLIGIPSMMLWLSRQPWSPIDPRFTLSRVHLDDLRETVDDVRRADARKVGKVGRPWTREAFAAFEARLRGRFEPIFRAFDDEVSRRHTFSIQPDEWTLDQWFETYFELWTLAGLYQIESEQYLATAEGQRDYTEKRDVQELVSLDVEDCRVALTRMTDPRYQW